MPSQFESVPLTLPGAQLSCTTPLTHERSPLATHTPCPHVVFVTSKSSSFLPSQSSSTLLHVVSTTAVGVHAPASIPASAMPPSGKSPVHCVEVYVTPVPAV